MHLAWSSRLLFHLLLVVIVIIISLQSLLCQPLGLFPDVLGHFLVPTLGWSVQTADPGHFQLKFLVLIVIVCDVDDACGFLDTLF